MKAFFKEIRDGDIDAALSRLDANPALIAATATAPPKKDDGQSPLQVAIKSGHFDIAHLLLERGADVDFMESSTLNRWNTLSCTMRSGLQSSVPGSVATGLSLGSPRRSRS